MNSNRIVGRGLLAITLSLAAFHTAAADDDTDFGMETERRLAKQAEKRFGIEKPLTQSAPATLGPYRSPSQAAKDQVLIAEGLKVEYLTRNAADNTDMMVFWPNDERPTHIITSVEIFQPRVIGQHADGSDKWTPAVQRIRLSDGKADVILRGLAGADGLRRTPWGTIVVAEEVADGGLYEILDPVNTTEQTVLNRALGTVTDPARIVKRTALPMMAWEGIGVLASGVIIAGDELRPGTATPDADGGAIFKFVPQVPYAGAGPITDLNQSPLVSGWVYALQVSCRNDRQQFGQGCEVGNGAWVPVNAATARADADAVGATGFYRPEDLEIDPHFVDASQPNAVRFCWTNTGNEAARNYGEVLCGIEREPATADANQRTVVINRFIEGDADFNQPDNIAFQPTSRNVFVIEDHPNGDIFACLPDGGDRDLKSDGCIKILSVKDSSAEPTGFFFAPDGKTTYLSIMHSNDANMPLVNDFGTDDIIKITGFKTVKRND